MRRPPVVLGMALLTCMALLVAVLLILFSVNPSVDRNEGEIRKAVSSQHAIICAQVQNTANAYRFRSLTPSGEVEPIRHFLTRMQAQQQTLRLARGSECRSAPGFPPVGLQVKRALHQINEILQHFEPALRRPVDEHLQSANKQPGFSQALPGLSHVGVGEEGVPAHLKHSVAPQSPAKSPEGHPGVHAIPPDAPSPLPSPSVPESPPLTPPADEAPESVNREAEPSSPETVSETKANVEVGIELNLGGP